jgi:hypothetical protein
MTPDLYHPVLDCFLRGLPHAYRSVAAPIGTTLLVEITGPSGGRWLLSKQSAGWILGKPSDGDVNTRVSIPEDIAWRVFTKGIDRAAARARMEVQGDQDLAERILRFTAIVG